MGFSLLRGKVPVGFRAPTDDYGGGNRWYFFMTSTYMSCMVMFKALEAEKERGGKRDGEEQEESAELFFSYAREYELENDFHECLVFIPESPSGQSAFLNTMPGEFRHRGAQCRGPHALLGSRGLQCPGRRLSSARHQCHRLEISVSQEAALVLLPWRTYP